MLNLLFCAVLLTGLLPRSILGLNSTNLTNIVQWDSHSLLIESQRIFILSAEVHPWRNPNPNLWRDVFDKVKDSGFNTVSFYSHWGLHYPFEGINNNEGDFQNGTYRDLQLFIDEAQGAGLWMIAR
jgi:beta-galactosidase GanA